MAATGRAQIIKEESKEYITIALRQLLEKEKLEDLSISKVCQRAGVSRMAFYRHYENLKHVLYEYYKPKISEIFEELKSQAPTRFEKQIVFFNQFQKDLFLSTTQGFEGIIQEIFVEELEFFYQGEDEYKVAFLSSGVYAIWRKWILDGQVRSLSEVQELIRKATFILAD
jgi:AcrR family transcriptional regulator